jgi:hypothetical protein
MRTLLFLSALVFGFSVFAQDEVKVRYAPNNFAMYFNETDALIQPLEVFGTDSTFVVNTAKGDTVLAYVGSKTCLKFSSSRGLTLRALGGAGFDDVIEVLDSGRALAAIEDYCEDSEPSALSAEYIALKTTGAVGKAESGVIRAVKATEEVIVFELKTSANSVTEFNCEYVSENAALALCNYTAGGQSITEIGTFEADNGLLTFTIQAPSGEAWKWTY